MADFIQAIKWIKEGKKVRRENWGNQSYHYKLNNEYVLPMSKDKPKPDNLIEIEGNDWQIVEEEKTLSDKTKIIVNDFSAYYEEDVKKFIKDIKEDIEDFVTTKHYKGKIKELIDKKAGDRLVEHK